MKLAEYIIRTEKGTEVTVCDDIYDIEVYFYNDEPEDVFDESLKRLSELLDVVSFDNDGVTVNLSELIETNIEELKNANLFYRCDIDNIMEDIEAIISGDISEKWMEKFVDCLE